MVDAIKEGCAIPTSDGSHKNRWVTASWRIMADTNEADQWAGLHVTPGRKDDQSAFRSEIGGTCAMAVAIELKCKFFQISNGSVSSGSDYQAVLYYIFDQNKKCTATTIFFDLIMATIKVLDRLPVSFSHRHVPAYQDISRDEMDIWGIANDDCDTDAKAFWKKEEAAGTLVTSTDLCDKPWSLWLQGEIFHRMLKETCTTLSVTRKQQILGTRGTYRIQRILMYQLDATPQKAPIRQAQGNS
jgi:hypothetical protein